MSDLLTRLEAYKKRGMWCDVPELLEEAKSEILRLRAEVESAYAAGRRAGLDEAAKSVDADCPITDDIAARIRALADA